MRGGSVISMLSHVLHHHHHTERDRPGVLGGGEKIALCIRNQISSVLLISSFFFGFLVNLQLFIQKINSQILEIVITISFKLIQLFLFLSLSPPVNLIRKIGKINIIIYIYIYTVKDLKNHLNHNLQL